MDELIAYYVNLLIVQYNGRPKARATIELFTRELLASNIFDQIKNAYDIENAVGKQLDVIGKYVGIDRYYKDTELTDFFAYTDYVESNPDTLEKYGFSNYSQPVAPQFNGTLTYDSVIAKDFKLNDDDYRTLLKLRIVQNYSNSSHESIDTSLFQFFGLNIIPDSEGDMKMYYFIRAPRTEIMRAAVYKNVLPKPMGVKILYLINYSDPIFGFATYDATPSSIQGFTTYIDYDTKVGETLTYTKLF